MAGVMQEAAEAMVSAQAAFKRYSAHTVGCYPLVTQTIDLVSHVNFGGLLVDGGCKSGRGWCPHRPQPSATRHTR
jgi:hypothetical protein